VESIRVMGRAAQGVRVVNINRPDFVVGVDRIVKEEEEEGEEGEGSAN
jgi:DNA gyrase subunit A